MLFLRAGKVEKQPLWAGNLQRDTKYQLSMETQEYFHGHNLASSSIQSFRDFLAWQIEQ